jgi:hypothetical protein
LDNQEEASQKPNEEKSNEEEKVVRLEEQDMMVEEHGQQEPVQAKAQDAKLSEIPIKNENKKVELPGEMVEIQGKFGLKAFQIACSYPPN